jgi:hypothetical protein
MSEFFRSIRAIASTTALGAVVFAAAACGGDKTDELQAAQRDVALAPPSTPAVLPPVADVPVTPPKTALSKPVPARNPAKTPPVTTPVKPPASTTPPAAPPGPAYGVVSSGSEFDVLPATKVCTNTQKVGDRVTATLAEAVNGSSGASIPAGATATLEVTKSQFGNNDVNKVALDFRVVSLSFDGRTYDVEGSEVTPAEVTKVRRQSTGDQAKKVAIGAAAGAVVGRVIGKSTKSTVVGGAIGAVGGAAAAAGTADYDGCVAAESRMKVKLTQDLRIRVG